jgi:hypothetical protein
MSYRTDNFRGVEHESMAVRLAVILRSEGYAAGALETAKI